MTPSIGDTIKVLPGSHHPSKIGTTGVVISIYEDIYEVQFEGYKWWMSEDEFEIVNNK